MSIVLRSKFNRASGARPALPIRFSNTDSRAAIRNKVVKSPLAWLAEQYSVGPRQVACAAGVAVTASLLIIVTGAVVRVTGSGLGCPEWPNCTDSTFAATPETGLHGAIEYGNRLLTGALCLVVGWLIVGSRLRRPLSRPILRGAWLQFWVIILNAIVGGITVWMRLSPYVVAAHFLAAILLLTTATVTWDRSRREAVPTPPASPRARALGTILLFTSAALLVVGTVVSGTGPHAGDSSDVTRLPLDWTSITTAHATLATAVVALTIAMLLCQPAGARRRTAVLLGVLLAQGAVGVLEVLTDVHSGAVVLHVLGSALVWAGAVRVFLDTRRVPSRASIIPEFPPAGRRAAQSEVAASPRRLYARVPGLPADPPRCADGVRFSSHLDPYPGARVDVRLEPMTEEEFGSWKVGAEAHFTQSILRSGVPATAAAAEAAETFAALLPDGVATAGHHLWYAYDGDRRVGFLWLKLTGFTAFVYNIAVEQDQRRRGYGRAIMEAGERWSRTNGATTIGLHVFTHNHGARSLYEQLGYLETGRRLSKGL
ncbi:COX15/CtaA family protein [Micromonospora sp. CA-246542]|uniref:COX15/CtaA family protein n=1 Tax=Micromonospora sp. CA-246542 TaxID=3239959 RepID=UPI003D914963